MRVIGISIRTKNAKAMFDLPMHWAKFQKNKDRIPGNGQIVVVYSNYESDHNGYYDYLVGKEVSDPKKSIEGFQEIEIPTGEKSWSHTVEGNMPLALIGAWKEIWQMNLNRAFKIDYEIHKEPNLVEIHLGLK